MRWRKVNLNAILETTINYTSERTRHVKVFDYLGVVEGYDAYREITHAVDIIHLSKGLDKSIKFVSAYPITGYMQIY